MQIDRTRGRARDGPSVTRNGIHDDVSYETQIAAINPCLIRSAERQKAGLFSLNGVNLEPLSKTIELGRGLAEYRAGITARAFENSRLKVRPANE